MTLKKHFFQALTIVIAMAFFSNTHVFAQEQKYYPDPDTLVQKKLEQWQDLKFGLLMHWGPYSQRGIVESWSICPEDVGWATGARVNKCSRKLF